MERREVESVALIGAALLLAFATLFFATACGPEDATSEAVTPTCDCRPGDLVITELMINPAGEDEGMEYVEIMNASSREIHLEGLVVISGSDTRPEVSSITGWVSPSVGPGNRIVVSEAPPSTSPDYVTVGSMLLSNAAGTLSLMCGPVEIDSVTWGASPAVPPDGIALQRAPSVDGNAPPAWCASTDPVDANGLRGSPGRPNHACGTTAGCVDSATGLQRPAVRPLKDDIVVTEVFANPEGADTLSGEWIEILALSNFDLAGVGIIHFNGPDENASSREFRIPGGDCKSLKIGQVAVIGGEGGIPLEGTSTMFNATGGIATIRFEAPSGNPVATARHPRVPDGASVSLKKSVAAGSDAVLGDDEPSSWVTTRCANGTAATPGYLDVTCRATK